MKTYHRMILAALLPCGLLLARPAPAADNPPAPAPDAAASPAKKAAPKQAHPAEAKKPAALPEREAAAPLPPGPAVVKENSTNVRGQATVNSEVVARLKKGDRVMVLEDIAAAHPQAEEPARWARIALPTNVNVWVHTGFIEAAGHTVIPKRLNMRGGPGENYSVLGRLEKGAPVHELETKGEWIKIDPGTNGFAFVASRLLTPEAAEALAIAAAAPPPTVATPAPAPAPAAPPPAATAPAPATPPAETTAPTPAPATPTPEPATPPPAVAAVPTPAPAPAPAETTPAPAPVEPVPTTPMPLPSVKPQPAPQMVEEARRIVIREGIVRRSVSIQAPSYYVLESLDTGKPINYLFSTNIALRDFKGRRIVVTGEELLDERWPNTPVIAIEKTNNIDVVP